MYEDGEGVARDLDEAGRIYKTIPDFPSAMLHFAIAYVEGRRVPQDYVEAYKLLLLANKFRSMNPPTRNRVTDSGVRLAIGETTGMPCVAIASHAG